MYVDVSKAGNGCGCDHPIYTMYRPADKLTFVKLNIVVLLRIPLRKVSHYIKTSLEKYCHFAFAVSITIIYVESYQQM